MEVEKAICSNGGKGLALLFAVFLVFSAPAYSTTIYNGDFELSEPNEMGAMPLGWTTENYARVHNEYKPVFERGQTVDWSFPKTTVTPVQGESFLVLSTGDIGVDSSISFASASQEITFEAGKTLHGKYFFGTGDYLGWNDYAEITLVPGDPNSLRGIELLYVDVEEVGDYQSTAGWQTFQHTFTESDAGSYHLKFSVYDKTDKIFKSYLMIDDVRCSDVPPGGDFNADGLVDYQDFKVFSEVVYQDCNDPNAVCEYHDITGTQRSFDYNDDGFITIDDVHPVVQHWLWKPED